MPLEYYFFVVFVFVLIIVVLFIINMWFVKSRKKEVKLPREREERLFTLYQNIEDMLDSFEEYVEDTMKDIENEKKQIGDMVYRVKTSLEELQELSSYNRGTPEYKAEDNHSTTIKTETVKQIPIPPVPQDFMDYTESKAGNIAEELPGNNEKSLTKKEKVLSLAKDGLSPDEIAKHLGIGKVEVKLILNIN